jgi:hypothetical protein
MIYRFDADLWAWSEHPGSWWFVTLPEDAADEIDDQQRGPRRGFGAVKVRVTLGGSTWVTSIFPSKEQASYVLPIKSAVRAKEKVPDGARVTLALELIDPSTPTS